MGSNLHTSHEEMEMSVWLVRGGSDGDRSQELFEYA